MFIADLHQQNTIEELHGRAVFQIAVAANCVRQPEGPSSAAGDTSPGWR